MTSLVGLQIVYIIRISDLSLYDILPQVIRSAAGDWAVLLELQIEYPCRMSAAVLLELA